jgi:hypothetical protein
MVVLFNLLSKVWHQGTTPDIAREDDKGEQIKW